MCLCVATKGREGRGGGGGPRRARKVWVTSRAGHHLFVSRPVGFEASGTARCADAERVRTCLRLAVKRLLGLPRGVDVAAEVGARASARVLAKNFTEEQCREVVAGRDLEWATPPVARQGFQTGKLPPEVLPLLAVVERPLGAT